MVLPSQMGWVKEFRSHHKLPSHHHHCDLYNPSIASWSVCIYHPIDFPIPPPRVASHPIHNPPLELSTIPPHTHIQPPRYHRTAIIFLDISRKAGPLPPIAFALSAYYSYILHICTQQKNKKSEWNPGVFWYFVVSSSACQHAHA